MGLDVLKRRSQEILNANPAARVSKAGKFFTNSLQCLESFLLFLASNPAVIAQFRTFLFNLKALAAAQVAALDIFIAQLERLNGTAQSFINLIRGLGTQAASQLAPFDFAAFNTCPAVAFIKEETKKFLPTIPGISKFKNKLPALAWIKRKEQEVRGRTNYIDILKARRDEIKVYEEVWNGIIDAIDDQFTI